MKTPIRSKDNFLVFGAPVLSPNPKLNNDDVISAVRNILKR